VAITANILMSLAIDHFGWLGMETHAMNAGRMTGAALMVVGIALISYF
jgi:bacterial/archaeal transporter family-2 protein